MQHDLDGGMLALKSAGELLDEPGEDRDSHEADFDPADLAARRLPRNHFGFFGFAQDVACPFQEPLSGVGEFDVGVAAPLNQPGAQPRLQLLNLVGQRGGADVEIGGGAAEMLLFGQRDEIAKQARFNVGHSFDAIE